jgi:hypothetical protein
MTMPLESQSVTWKSDGAEVQGWPLKPEKSVGKLPLITVVHGGPAGAWQPRFIGPGLGFPRPVGAWLSARHTDPASMRSSERHRLTRRGWGSPAAAMAASLLCGR